MTTVMNERVTCAVCGTSVEVAMLASTNRMGSADLDTRPPEMQRSTISCWVQACGSCGFCAPDLTFAAHGAAEVVRSAAYQQLWRDASLPDLARRFLCSATVKEAAGEFAKAFWSSLHAAWACDDARAAEMAAMCRGKALERAVRARSAAQPILEQVGAEELVLTDVLRRAGRFDEAHAMVRAGIHRGPDPFIKRLLAFEKELGARHDAACHTIEEADQRSP